jgi:hypothetical protein
MTAAEQRLAEELSNTVRLSGRLTLIGAYRGAVMGQQASVIIGVEYVLFLLGATQGTLAAVRSETAEIEGEAGA